MDEDYDKNFGFFWQVFKKFDYARFFRENTALRATYVAKGIKVCHIKYSIEKTKSSNKDFDQILDENKILKSGTDDVMKVQVDFYKHLFTSEGIDDSACDYFGKYITKVL